MKQGGSIYVGGSLYSKMTTGKVQKERKGKQTRKMKSDLSLLKRKKTEKGAAPEYERREKERTGK